MCDSWSAVADTGGIWRGGAAGREGAVVGLVGGLEGCEDGWRSGEGVAGFLVSNGDANARGELVAGRDGGSDGGVDAGGVAFPRRRAGLT